jgi:hypothetical protein
MNAVIELYEDTGKEFPPGNLLMGQVPFNGAARREMLRG